MIGEAADADAQDEDDYEDVVIFTDISGERITIAEPAPEDLAVDELVERFGEVGADDAYDRMLAGH